MVKERFGEGRGISSRSGRAVSLRGLAQRGRRPRLNLPGHVAQGEGGSATEQPQPGGRDWKRDAAIREKVRNPARHGRLLHSPRTGTRPTRYDRLVGGTVNYVTLFYR